MNSFGHVDLRVREIGPAVDFYTRLLRELGFEPSRQGKTWTVFRAPGHFPHAPFFALLEDPEHRPNENRIAFWRPEREGVDRVGALLVGLGAQIESGPRVCPEYSPSYYAVFFRDPSGNRLEVMHRTD